MISRKAALGTIAALALLAPSAAAADPYVALGDSIGANYGATPSTMGYVPLLYADYQSSLAADQLFNHSAAGATSTALISGQLPSALTEINAASDTKAVSVEIGGNDYLTHQCTTNWDDPSSCPFRANLATALTQLQAALAADPGDEPFTVMTLYNPGSGTAGEATYNSALLGSNHAVNCTDSGAQVGLNDVVFQEASKLGIAVADPYPAFKAGGQSLIYSDGIHPNNAGHAAIAQAFRDAAVPPVCVVPPPDPDPGDTTPPETTITKAPPAKTEHRKVTYEFGSSEHGSTFECRLDGGDYAPCTSPKKLKHLKRGRHTFRVRAADAAHNTDQSPAKSRFKVV